MEENAAEKNIITEESMEKKADLGIKDLGDFTEPERLYQELIKRVRKYHPSDDISTIEKAYHLALEAHKDQKRKSGEPYIVHPLSVAIILADLEMDKETIVAGLLHDIVEDTDTTIDELKGYGFSDRVLDALRLMTHAEGVDYYDYVKEIGKDPLARKVKIADLEHNMQLGRLNEVRDKDLKRAEKYKVCHDYLCGLND
jgi:Guanosine polyphosphate pyrophosphohydrolases/synthetases